MAEAVEQDFVDGRLTHEPRARERTEGQRDRDRVLYSTAFQRLTGITQVASPEIGRGFHTRLIHSLKVAQIARRLAEALTGEAAAGPRHIAQLDADVVEAAALAHDLGHPPFGHLSEKVLDDRARTIGGFEGNAQSVRVVTRLSQRSRHYDGLNLTRRVLNGVIKYPRLGTRACRAAGDKYNAYEVDEEHFAFAREGWPEGVRSLEAEIMDWADDVTYAVHDMEDFYRAGLIPLDRLSRQEEERNAFIDSFFADGEARTTLRSRIAQSGSSAEDLVYEANALFGQLISIGPYDGGLRQRQMLKGQSSGLIGRYMRAFSINPVGLDEGAPLANVEPSTRAQVTVLKELTWFYVIMRPSLATVQAGQRRVMHELLDAFSEAARRDDTAVFPRLEADLLAATDNFRDRLRIVIDFVAGLTEEKALELHQRLLGVPPAPLFEAHPF